MAKGEKNRGPIPLPAQVERAVRAAEEKKAFDLTVLDLRKAAGFTDFFVIASGTSARQVRAIADAAIEALDEAGIQPAHVEGYDRCEWVLVDYFDFILHVFAPQTRLFYGLERLWGSAERVDIPPPSGPPQRLPPSRGGGEPGRSESGVRRLVRHDGSAKLHR